jgi:UDP-N-acetylmuramoylalanine--D-glutamate ligase
MRERYLVVGLARSGVAACEAIRRVWPDAAVVAADDRSDIDVGRLRELGVEPVTGGDVVPVSGMSAVVKSPGVPAGAPQIVAAREAGVPVWSEVELGARMLPNPIAGVTGTNGKTTTTELLGAMLRAGGLACEVAGNVGRPLSALAGRVDRNAWIACELSSFQLEDIDTLRCRIGVALNLTPDHLDRHGTVEEYLWCKLRIFENQRPGDVAIVNGDNPTLRDVELPGRGERVVVTLAQAEEIDWEHALLRGDHNLENALAAAAAARAAGVRSADIDRALREFAPLPHRLEPVANAGGVEFVNDSKATNPDATIQALTAFTGGVRLILGGSLKGSDFADLARAVAGSHVERSYLIGAAADAVAEALSAEGVPFERSGTLAAAVHAASAAAGPGETVLLSPACASFDQFRDYEDRGDTFRRLAQEVAGAA